MLKLLILGKTVHFHFFSYRNKLLLSKYEVKYKNAKKLDFIYHKLMYLKFPFTNMITAGLTFQCPPSAALAAFSAFSFS